MFSSYRKNAQGHPIILEASPCILILFLDTQLLDKRPKLLIHHTLCNLSCVCHYFHALNHQHDSMCHHTIRNLELEKEKVSLAEKEKIDFLRTASHELKTPVTELNATLENMILGIGEYRDYETYLPKCKEITEQLGDMIRDILNASRLQTQGNNEPCSNFSLRTLLTELCEPYRLIAEAKGIKFKIELSSDAFVYLPEGRLKKAISNILSNAVNYTEAGQSISVVFDKNKLSVSNECSVLPPEQLQHIFEPFYRPDLAHSQATGGNGLGLYIVQTILDKLRLKYQFVPMPNDRGMSFTIQF